jgi:hypothetical protein
LELQSERRGSRSCKWYAGGEVTWWFPLNSAFAGRKRLPLTQLKCWWRGNLRTAEISRYLCRAKKCRIQQISV